MVLGPAIIQKSLFSSVVACFGGAAQQGGGGLRVGRKGELENKKHKSVIKT